MAMFYEYIKGVNQKTNSGTKYTYIVWPPFDSGALATPWLAISNSNRHSVSQISDEEKLGHILTTDVESPYFTNDLKLINGLTTNLIKAIESGIINFNSKVKFNYDTEFNKISAEEITVSNDFTTKFLTITNTAIFNTISASGLIKSDTYMEAQYFNAISDMRLKENIKIADFSAIDIIKLLTVFTFNYKKTKEPSIGLLAQEAQKIKIEDFELVTNNDEYLTIKESKLVYILWKAVQELSKEVKQLKEELKNK